jgi:hypothetical protein
MAQWANVLLVRPWRSPSAEELPPCAAHTCPHTNHIIPVPRPGAALVTLSLLSNLAVAVAVPVAVPAAVLLRCRCPPSAAPLLHSITLPVSALHPRPIPAHRRPHVLVRFGCSRQY